VRCSLRVPYADSCARSLAWHLGPAGSVALGTVELALPGARVELNVLGGSHHVVVAMGGVACSEVVACSPGAAGLPETAERSVGGLNYAFVSRTELVGPAVLARRAERLVRRLSARPDALVGIFPGSPHAVTALVAAATSPPGGVAWRTWHVYPNTGEVVTTRSLLAPGPPA
jgi:hypothetical protein